MAKMKYYNGTDEIVGGFTTMNNAEFRAKFPGIVGKRSDSFAMRVGRNAAGEIVPITRIIERKSNPSNHKCGAKCRHAKGGVCECECGGKYHGAGG